MSPIHSKAAPKKTKAAASVSKPKSPALPSQVGGTHRRELQGLVVSDKMQKTIVVTVDRKVRHGLYQKYVTRTKRFKAHDENNSAKTGDLVLIVESRPLSRDKCWALKSILRRAGQAATVEANV